MTVQIVINGENANEAIQELAALSAGIAGRSAVTEPAVAPEAPKPERPARATRTRQETTKASPADQPEPESEQIVDEPEAGAEDDSGDTNEPIPTDVELREIARTVGSKGPEAKAQIKGLLTKYGVSNITAVPDEKRIAFKRELEAIAE